MVEIRKFRCIFVGIVLIFTSLLTLHNFIELKSINISAAFSSLTLSIAYLLVKFYDRIIIVYFDLTKFMFFFFKVFVKFFTYFQSSNNLKSLMNIVIENSKNQKLAFQNICQTYTKLIL